MAAKLRAKNVQTVAEALVGLADQLQLIESVAVVVAEACEGAGEEHAGRVLRQSLCVQIAQQRQALEVLRASLRAAAHP